MKFSMIFAVAGLVTAAAASPAADGGNTGRNHLYARKTVAELKGLGESKLSSACWVCLAGCAAGEDLDYCDCCAKGGSCYDDC
ncbi:hypothetical protein ACKRZS_003160 [Fusarium odoratissimum]|nr:hypothetical protein NOF04DRAFT_1395146 [Fusarium oxysporum II5]